MVISLLLAVLSAEGATARAIARVHAVDAQIHAVIALDPTALDQARAIDRGRRARGLLYGYAILLKDNIEADGPLPTTAGSMALLDNVTHRDAPLVARLRAADAVILGKTNLSEWANIRSNASISGWSGVGGQTRNPHALDRDPCGSSSGSAAAVAAGEVEAAIGTETDGSITCPAALNGVVGLKPTVGLVSRTHIVPISHSQDTAGPIAADVRTVARVLQVIAGADPADPATRDADAHILDYLAVLKPDALRGARIGVLRFATGWSAETDKLFEQALSVLKAQGATLVDIAALKDRDKLGEAETLVLNTEFRADVNAYLATTPSTVKTRTLADLIAFNAAHAGRELALFGQETFVKAEATKGLDDAAYQAARRESLRIAGHDGIDALLAASHLDALISPTMPPAWKIDAANGDQIAGAGAGSLAAIAGYPHLTVPMGAVLGLPVGLSLIGPAWSEGRLLGYGYAYEQAARAKVTPRFLPSIEAVEPVAPLLAPLLPVAAAAQSSTAAGAIARIQQRYPNPVPDTVDTVKAGDPSTPVTGIATTFLDTMAVLKEANRRGLNLVITHEPTFYNHRDSTTFFADDPVYQEKLAFIEQHHMVVFRLHDEIHRTAPDPFGVGLVEALGWQSYAKPDDPFHVTIPPTRLEDLAKTIQTKLQAKTLRVVGDPNLVVRNIALAPGAAGLETQVMALRPKEIELLIAGEAAEWEAVEYVRDASNQGLHKALILLGHQVSEEPGMEKCTQDLRVLFPKMKVEHILAGNPLWLPGAPPAH